MNKEITIIDLLNKIANGEEIPKKIKYKEYIYEYQRRRDTIKAFNYMCNENGEYLSRKYFIDNILNDKVEIIEEEREINKIIGLNNVGNSKDLGEFKDKQQLNNHILKDKINELIDEINALELIDEVNALKEDK